MTANAHKDLFRKTPLLRSLPETLSIHDVRTGEVVGYPQMVDRVGQRLEGLAHHLSARPARVVIGLSDPLDVLVNLFAVWAAGQCAVLVNPKLSGDEKRRVMAKVTACLWLGDAGDEVFERDIDDRVSLPDAALILMTSGTTGDPKGVTHSLATLEARLKLNVAEIGLDTLAETLCPLPLFFGHGLIGNCLTPLYAGQRVHVLETPGLQDYAAFGGLIDQLGISFLSSVPSMWRMVLRMSPPPKCAPLRVHVGSAPLPEALWTEIEHWCGTARVFNTYGMTETANWISGGTRPASDADGFVGTPWGGSVHVWREGTLHDHGRGEVVLKSPAMMLGLWGGAGQSDLQDGALMTGDIGELSKDQTLRLVGRTKNEINRGGIKVLAEEVDMLLERHPDVAEACAFGIPDEIAGELVGAVVRLNEASVLTQEALTAWCRGQVRMEAVPSRVAIVADIAKNDRGKLARNAIQTEMIQKWS